MAHANNLWFHLLLLALVSILVACEGDAVISLTYSSDPPATSSNLTTSVAPTDPPSLTSHPLIGFEDCIMCHYGNGSTKTITPVHYCNECHDMQIPLSFDHTKANNACPLCHME